jgi:hypothetical protein
MPLLGEQAKTIDYRFHAAKSREREKLEPSGAGDKFRHANGRERTGDSLRSKRIGGKTPAGGAVFQSN